MIENMPTGWRFWMLVALIVFFSIAFHPWWLLLISLAVYCSLVWLVFPPNKN